MKWFLKWAFRLFVFVLLLVLILVLSADAILKSLLEHQIRSRTGMEARIGRLSVGLLSPVLTMENCKLYNTAEFGGTPFLDIPELYLEYDRAALAQRTLHVKLLRLNLAELCIVKTASNRTNLNTPPTNLKSTEMTFAGIDVLNLSLGRVRFLDLKHPALNREFSPHVQNQVLRGIKTPEDLYGVLILIWLRSGGGFVDFSNPAVEGGITAMNSVAASPPVRSGILSNE